MPDPVKHGSYIRKQKQHNNAQVDFDYVHVSSCAGHILELCD